ncbi:MAG: AAA family ATPase [Candidatus Thermoplasmatota archaeon]|nr:AAA family ATPase [Candidatus Thermoplasmatota archaeon]MCL5963417.1 AAA family ATPase [Candidatus Thermoplasmatota archaeon]
MKTLNAKKGFTIDEIETSEDIAIPKDPLDRIIGQDEAVETARIAAYQRRHLLLFGPPGIGKSMTAQAISFHIQAPEHEIRVVDNPESHERPFIEVLTKEQVFLEHESKLAMDGDLIDPENAPADIAEKLGYRCSKCGMYSSYTEVECPSCGTIKGGAGKIPEGPFKDILGGLGGLLEVTMNRAVGNESIKATRIVNGSEEIVAYEKAGDKIKILNQRALEKRREHAKKRPSKVLVPINRSPFVIATGASETELLGDVRHDPYGGHPTLGQLPFERVVAGVIHDSHEGVLFIDEIPQLGILQRYILTAMQEKKFPISGRNPQSSGASVRVDAVPCDFIFVGSANIEDLQYILPPLRSRILGNGYEVLLSTTMEDNERNVSKLAQFIAQEIANDGKIPHASREAIYALIDEARRRAKYYDEKPNRLTLRLRELGGVIRVAGDMAKINHKPLIEASDVNTAIKKVIPIEEAIKRSIERGDKPPVSKITKTPYYNWNVTEEPHGYD